MWRSVPQIVPMNPMLLLCALIIGVSSGQSMAGDGVNSHTLAQEQQVAGGPLNGAILGAGENGRRNLDDAGQLLSKAIAAFEAGNAPKAQRTFEALVGSHPTSPEADIARRYLARLYAVPATEKASAQLVVAEQQQSLVKMPEDAGNSTDSANWKPSERLSELMRATVGDRVFFAQGSTDLGLLARNVLRRQAGWLKQQHAGVRALVVGHADEPLDDEENTILSARRAEAVRARLIEEGVAPDRVSVTALGRSERIADCPSPQCKAQNRRVVTKVMESAGFGPADRQSYYRTPKEGDASAGW